MNHPTIVNDVYDAHGANEGGVSDTQFRLPSASQLAAGRDASHTLACRSRYQLYKPRRARRRVEYIASYIPIPARSLCHARDPRGT